MKDDINIITVNIDDDDADDSDAISVSETKKVLDIVNENPDFQKTIQDIRCRFRIPAKGYKYSDPEVNRKIPDLEKLLDECEAITLKFGMPKIWYISLAEYVTCNVFPRPFDRVISIHTVDEVRASGRFSAFGLEATVHSIAILINNKLSKTALLKQIENKFDSEIKPLIDKIPISPHHNMSMLRVELAKKIVILHDKDKLSFNKIATILAKKYSDNLYIFDKLEPDYIKNLYHYWKKKV
jgi:hypothetical protein